MTAKKDSKVYEIFKEQVGNSREFREQLGNPTKCLKQLLKFAEALIWKFTLSKSPSSQAQIKRVTELDDDVHAAIQRSKQLLSTTHSSLKGMSNVSINTKLEQAEQKMMMESIYKDKLNFESLLLDNGNQTDVRHLSDEFLSLDKGLDKYW